CFEHTDPAAQFGHVTDEAVALLDPLGPCQLVLREPGDFAVRAAERLIRVRREEVGEERHAVAASSRLPLPNDPAQQRRGIGELEAPETIHAPPSAAAPGPAGLGPWNTSQAAPSNSPFPDSCSPPSAKRR